MLMDIDMISSYNVDDVRAKYVAIKTMSHENIRVAVILVVLAEVSKLPPYVILNCKGETA